MKSRQYEHFYHKRIEQQLNIIINLLKKLTSYPQFKEKIVSTSWAISLMCPISVDAFFNNSGTNATTAFSTLIFFPIE